MLYTCTAGAPRRAAALAGILALHVGLVLVVLNDRIRPPAAVPAAPPIVRILAPAPPPPVQPSPQGPMDIGGYRVPEPVFPVPTFETSSGVTVETGVAESGVIPTIAGSPDFLTAPTVAMNSRRLSALIDSCYPAGARRAGEEGKAVVRIVIGANARPVSWGLVQSTGFPRLDSALPCVVGRIAFTAGTRNGQAVQSAAILPVVFRLH